MELSHLAGKIFTYQCFLRFELCSLCNCKHEILNLCASQTRATAIMGRLQDEGDTRLATSPTDDPQRWRRVSPAAECMPQHWKIVPLARNLFKMYRNADV